VPGRNRSIPTLVICWESEQHPVAVRSDGQTTSQGVLWLVAFKPRLLARFDDYCFNINWATPLSLGAIETSTVLGFSLS